MVVRKCIQQEHVRNLKKRSEEEDRGTAEMKV